MKKSLEAKLEHMHERFHEISRLLSDASIIANQDQFKALSKEYAQLEPIASCYTAYLEAQQDILSLQELQQTDDAELAAMAEAELVDAAVTIQQLDEALQQHLMPKDPDDERNVYL
jgi:peptide chain release factor 1